MRLLAAVIIMILVPGAAPVPASVPGAPNAAIVVAQQAPVCCRTCRAGKACGDSCIARNKVCTVGPGCACNADGSPPGRLGGLAALGIPEPAGLYSPIDTPAPEPS